MKKNNLVRIVSTIVFTVMLFSQVSIMADEVHNLSAEKKSEVISPRFIAIIVYRNNLVLNFGGRLTCQGSTEVQLGYIAKLKIELQQYNNGWSTIKTWNAQRMEDVALSRDYFVASGYQYRLKVTHQALDTNNNVIETHISYSRNITYL